MISEWQSCSMAPDMKTSVSWISLNRKICAIWYPLLNVSENKKSEYKHRESQFYLTSEHKCQYPDTEKC